MYARGKIYKLTCDGLTYYGSTVQPLCVRLGGHKFDYKRWKNGDCSHMTSCDLFDKGNPIITLVESFPCQSKEELLKRERYYIENNDCVNKQMPGQTMQEYYEKHRDELLARNKEYRDNNKDVIKAKKKETYLCKCGMTLAKGSKSNHDKTKFHKESMEDV